MDNISMVYKRANALVPPTPLLGKSAHKARQGSAEYALLLWIVFFSRYSIYDTRQRQIPSDTS